MKNKYFITTLSLFSIYLIWKVSAIMINSSLLLPTPEQVIRETLSVITSNHFLHHIGITTFKGIIGLIISLFLALIIAIPAGINTTVYQFFKPYLVIIRSIPVISFILLALIWLNPPNVPVFIAILTMFPILAFSIIDGIRETQHEYLEMAIIYNLSFRTRVRQIYLPSVSGMLFSGISNAAGFGWRAIIIGEVLSQPPFGIGSEMHQAQIYLMVPTLIAWTLIAIVISYIFENLIRFIQKITTRRYVRSNTNKWSDKKIW